MRLPITGPGPSCPRSLSQVLLGPVPSPCWGVGIQRFLSVWLTQEYGVLTASAIHAAKPDVQLTPAKPMLDQVQLKETTFEQAVGAGEVQIEGNREAAKEFFGMLDTFPFWFNIVTP